MESMMLPISSSSVIPTLPTATPLNIVSSLPDDATAGITHMHRTFFSWNLMVDLTSVNLAARSSACETGVGNLPAAKV